jgi:hypothetical protein
MQSPSETPSDEPVTLSSEVPPPRIDQGALDNPYLLRRIFEYFIPDYPLYEAQVNKQHLLWAALTSRTFLEPALDTLWSSMNSLIPLLKLLPAFQLVRDTYVSAPFLFNDAFWSSNMSQFRSYVEGCWRRTGSDIGTTRGA